MLDAYGNYDSETITIEVVEGAGPSDDGGLDESGGGSEAGGSTGGGDGTTGPGDTGDDTGIPLDGGGDDGATGGCRIATPEGSWLALLGLLALRRRRRD